MSRMVGDLLLLAEADLDEQPIHRRRVDLAPLLMDVYNSAQLIAGDKVTVRFEPIEPVTVEADPDRLKQVVLNLVDNAVKFTPRGGEVTVSLIAQPSGALIKVRDTGVGIPPEEQEAIFRRFYRVEESRSTRGSGLGLAISSWIVQAHGGRIDLRSSPGEGSTFSIWLPVG
jgi:signal transduction histidine kinase